MKESPNRFVLPVILTIAAVCTVVGLVGRTVSEWEAGKRQSVCQSYCQTLKYAGGLYKEDKCGCYENLVPVPYPIKE